VKLGTVCFTNKSPVIYYRKIEKLERQKTAVNSTVCPYVVGTVFLKMMKFD